jgi:hypothetical protein
MNGVRWAVAFADPTDPVLVDRTGRRTVAVTDAASRTVYLSVELTPPFLYRVLVHELAHCAMLSYGILAELHAIVPYDRWIEAEEWVCNFIADYGAAVYESAYGVLGCSAWTAIPPEFDRYMS